MDQALDGLEVRVYRESVRALAASTDGLLRLALRLPGGEPHAPFFRPLFDFAATSRRGRPGATRARTLSGVGAVCARTDDDKTLVLAARGQGQARRLGGPPARERPALLPAPAADPASGDFTD